MNTQPEISQTQDMSGMGKKLFVPALILVVIIAVFGLGVVVILLINQANQLSLGTLAGYRLLETTDYSIEYPENWEKEETLGGLVNFFYPSGVIAVGNNIVENVNVVIQDVPGMTFEEYDDLSIKQIESGLIILESEVVSQESIFLDGHVASKVVYTGGDGNISPNIKIIGVWTVVDDRAYVITYLANIYDFETYVDEANAMIDTFRFK